MPGTPVALNRSHRPPWTILHINTAFGWRGGERQVLWLSEGLNAAGVRSIVAARPDQPLATKLAERDLPFVPLSPRGEWDPRAVLTLHRAMRARAVHLVHAHDGHAVTLAALALGRSRTRFVITRRSYHRLRRNPVSRWKYRRADAVIAVSDFVADVLERSGVDRGRIFVVHSGVDLDRRVEPAGPQALRDLGVVESRPLAVMVAALDPSKDPLTFVRAIHAARLRVPPLQALLVGDGPLREEVHAAVQDLGIEGVLHLAGSRADAESLLAAADVAVLSSLAEGLGSVVLDALSFGVPVAATETAAITEMIHHREHGLLTPVGDAETLGAAIAELLADRELAGRLARAGSERVQEFSVDRTVAGTLRVYENVLDRSPVGSCRPDRSRAAGPGRDPG